MVYVIRGGVVDKETSYQINMCLCADKSMFLTTSWCLFAFRDNFSPVKGLFRIVETNRVEIAETTFEYLISSVKIQSIWFKIYLFWKAQAAP